MDLFKKNKSILKITPPLLEAFCIESLASQAMHAFSHLLWGIHPAILESGKKDCKSWRIEEKRKMALMCWRLLCEMPIHPHSLWIKQVVHDMNGSWISIRRSAVVPIWLWCCTESPAARLTGTHFCGADSTLGQKERRKRGTTHYNKWCYSGFTTHTKRFVLKFHLHQDIFRNFVKIQRLEPFPRDLLSLYTYGMFTNPLSTNILGYSNITVL